MGHTETASCSRSSESEPQTVGLMAEFTDVDGLLAAARKVRDAGYKNWECFTPCPIHGLDAAMGHKPTRLPWIVLACGLTGLMSGLFLVWWTNATGMDGLPYALRGYEFVVSGKPVFSLPAKIPPIFELTILFSAFGAFFGMLAMNRLPRLHNPVFNNRRFDRVTDDRFFVVIDATDPAFRLEATGGFLRDAGAAAVEEVRA